MPKFIVTDESRKEHLVDAPAPAMALMQTPNSNMVRLATHNDLLLLDEDYRKNWEEEGKFKKESQHKNTGS